jgi:hypothetical protein
MQKQQKLQKSEVDNTQTIVYMNPLWDLSNYVDGDMQLQSYHNFEDTSYLLMNISKTRGLPSKNEPIQYDSPIMQPKLG